MSLLNYQEQQPNIANSANQYLTDELNPSTAQSLGYSMKSTEMQLPLAISNGYSYLTNAPLSDNQKALEEHYLAAASIANSSQGFWNKGADVLGNIAGTLINPLSLVPAARVGSLFGEGAAGLLNYGAQKAILPSFLESSTANLATKGAAEGALVGAAYMVPSALTDNYNAVRNQFNWNSVGKETLMGTVGGALALGITLPLLPFAKKLIEAKKESNLPLSPTEEALDRKDALTPEDAPAAASTINDNIDSDIVVPRGTQVEIPVYSEDDVKNLQSAIVDNLVSKGTVDTDFTKALFSDSKTFNKFISHDLLQSTLDKVQPELQNQHSNLQNQVKSITQKRLSTLKNTLLSNTFLPGSVRDSIANEEDPLTFLNKLNEKDDNGQSPLEMLQKNENLNKRSVSHLNEMQELSGYISHAKNIDKLSDFFDSLKSARVHLPLEPNDAIAKSNAFYEKRYQDSSPDPLTEPEQAGVESISQSKFEKTFETPESMVTPELTNELAKNAPQIEENVNNIKKAFSSLKKNNKVFDSLISCLQGKE